LQELLASVHESCSSAVNLPPGFVRDIIVEQVGTDVSNKTAAMNLAVATQLSDHILDEVNTTLKATCDQLVRASQLLFLVLLFVIFLLWFCATECGTWWPSCAFRG